MVTVKKYEKGKLKGYRITQTKDLRFYIYKGSTCQLSASFNTFDKAELVLKEHYQNLPNWNNKKQYF